MNGFFKFSLANILTILLLLGALFNWWGKRESDSATLAATQAVIIAQHGERIKSLEDANRQFAVDMSDVKNKLNLLVAIADEQRKAQHK